MNIKYVLSAIVVVSLVAIGVQYSTTEEGSWAKSFAQEVSIPEVEVSADSDMDESISFFDLDFKATKGEHAVLTVNLVDGNDIAISVSFSVGYQETRIFYLECEGVSHVEYVEGVFFSGLKSFDRESVKREELVNETRKLLRVAVQYIQDGSYQEDLDITLSPDTVDEGGYRVKIFYTLQ